MHLKPRNPRRDRLVNEALAVYSYFQIGTCPLIHHKYKPVFYFTDTFLSVSLNQVQSSLLQVSQIISQRWHRRAGFRSCVWVWGVSGRTFACRTCRTVMDRNGSVSDRFWSETHGSRHIKQTINVLCSRRTVSACIRSTPVTLCFSSALRSVRFLMSWSEKHVVSLCSSKDFSG